MGHLIFTIVVITKIRYTLRMLIRFHKPLPIIVATLLSLTCLMDDDAKALTATERYQSCTERVRVDPKSALTFAQNWEKERGDASATHCRALALYALQRYSAAAQVLERLSGSLYSSDLNLWSSIINQTASSWQQAGLAHRAIATLNRAVLQIDGSARNNEAHAILAQSFLVQRAAIHASRNQTLEATQDYDHALSYGVNQPHLLLARAKLFLSINERALARDDLEAVLKSTSSKEDIHKESKALLKGLS